MTDKQQNKLWGGRFSESTDQFVQEFTASVNFDRRMYRQDIFGSQAHATMLAEVGVLTEEERDAALRLIQFMTSPDQAAAWSIATGYMGVSPAAYDTVDLIEYTEGFPAALVARNQLEHAVAEFSTFETARVRDGLNTAIQSALTGTMSAADALAEAQAAADRLLSDYR